MYKLLVIFSMVILIILVGGCRHDSGIEPFHFDLGDIDSNENVGGRDFGIYTWSIPSLEFPRCLVVVVPYDPTTMDLILSEQAVVTITINNSIYEAIIHEHEGQTEEESLDYLIFDVAIFDNPQETICLNYTYNNVTKNYSITIPFADSLTSITSSDFDIENPEFSLAWDIENSSHYQLLSAEIDDDNENSEDNFFCDRVNGSVRTYTFPEAYNFNPAATNHYYSLTQVMQITTGDLIGLDVVIYGYDIDGNGKMDIKKVANISDIHLLVKEEFQRIHKPLLERIIQNLDNQ
ncbi:hypothetical protein JEZ13_05785 [bacterium]|nr:hypothetical protein [bacterium]